MRELTIDNLNQIAEMMRQLQGAESDTGLTIDGAITIIDDESGDLLGKIIGNDSDFLFVPA